jgi:hypothetical protein
VAGGNKEAAGKPDSMGRLPEGSSKRRVSEKLAHMSEVRQAFGKRVHVQRDRERPAKTPSAARRRQAVAESAVGIREKRSQGARLNGETGGRPHRCGPIDQSQRNCQCPWQPALMRDPIDWHAGAAMHRSAGAVPAA